MTRVHEKMLNTISHQGHAIEMTVRCHFTPIGTARIKNRTATRVGRGTEKLEPSYSAGGVRNGAAAVENALVEPRVTIRPSTCVCVRVQKYTQEN